MLLETLSQSFRKARSVNYTTNGYPSRVPTATTPQGDAGTATGASIQDLAMQGLTSQNVVLALFYGTGANNTTFSARLIGWRDIISDGNLSQVTPLTALWFPVPLCEFQVTLSATQPGVAGKAIVATELFADTITITGTTANAGVSVDVVSPANDTIAHAVVDVKGFRKLEFIFTTGGSATDCNALLALL